jgi:hypothetical protein
MYMYIHDIVIPNFFGNHLQVSKLHLHCIRKCGWKGTWGKMKEHLKECGLGKMEMRERGRGGGKRGEGVGERFCNILSKKKLECS